MTHARERAQLQSLAISLVWEMFGLYTLADTAVLILEAAVGLPSRWTMDFCIMVTSVH